MKRRKISALKDERGAVYKSQIESNQRKIDAIVEKLERLVLEKEKESDSISAISGGRPESNRRKF